MTDDKNTETAEIRFFIPEDWEYYFLPKNTGHRIWDRDAFLEYLAEDLARTEPCLGPVGEYFVVLGDFALSVVHAGYAPTRGKSAEDFIEIDGKRYLRRELPDSPDGGSRVIVVTRDKADEWDFPSRLTADDLAKLESSDATHVIVDIVFEIFGYDGEDDGPDLEWCECADEVIKADTTKFHLAIDESIFDPETAGPTIRDREAFLQALARDMIEVEPYIGGRYIFQLSADTLKLVDMGGAAIEFSRAIIFTRQDALHGPVSDLTEEARARIAMSDATHVITEITVAPSLAN